MNTDIRSAGEHSFWEGLSPEVQRALKSLAKQRHYGTGSQLFRKGEAGRGIFVLRAGKVRLSAISNQERSLVFRIALPGQALGLSATVRGKPYEATAEATGPSEIDFVTRLAFLRLLDRYPEACFHVVSTLSQELFAANQQVRLFCSGRTTSTRLAALLLAWCGERGVETDQGIRVTVPQTEREMGQMLGVSRETVARLFGKLRDERVAEFSGRDLLIHDKQALESIATPQTKPLVVQGSANMTPGSGERRIQKHATTGV